MPALTDVRSVEPANFRTADGLSVRVQLLDARQHRELAAWPTERRLIEMRYSDIGPIELRVPTLTSFAGMKTAAWMDRGAARDLYDLAVLAGLDVLTARTADLVREITGLSVAPHVFRSLPRFDWTTQLAHQTKHLPTPEHCIATVRAAYAQALGWESD